jgi:Nucleotidyltransferase domain.
MSFGLAVTPQQRELLENLLREHIPGVQVWAFGSRTQGGARAESDLDLTVFSGPEQTAAVSRLREALEESNLPFRVDVLIWREIPESFQKNITDTHVVLVETP